MSKRIGKNDCIFLAIIGLLIVLSMLAFTLKHKEKGAEVTVELHGAFYQSYSLLEDGTYIVLQDDGATNTLCIESGYAYVVDCSCPDKLCEHQRHISKDGETIVCLPNQFVATVKSNNNSKYDGVAK